MKTTIPQIENDHPNDESEIISRVCRPFSEWPEIMRHPDLVTYCGLSEKHAWKILKSKELHRIFPDDRRSMSVAKYALRDFMNGRYISENDQV